MKYYKAGVAVAIAVCMMVVVEFPINVQARESTSLLSVSGSEAVMIDNGEYDDCSDMTGMDGEWEGEELSVSGSNVVVSSEINYLAENVYKEQLSIETYNESIYRAECYLSEGSTCYKNIASLLEMGIPSDVIVNIGKNDWGFMSSVTAWKGVNMLVTPSQIAEGMLDEVGYYEAIIFSIFIEQSTDEDYIYRLLNETNAETNAIISQIKTWVEKTDSLEKKIDVSTGEFKKLSESDAKKLEEQLEKAFIENHPWLDGAYELGGMVKTVFEYSDTLIDAVKTMTSYMQLSELPQEMKTVILRMYDQCPSNNTCMKQALKEAAEAVGSLSSAFSVSVLHTVNELTADVAGELIDDWWDSVLSKNKYALAYAYGAKLGIAISNTLFATDKTIEEFDRMACLQEFYELLEIVVQKSGETFIHARTVDNASAYIAAVDTLYKTGELSCDFAMKFEEVYYTESVAALKLLWEKDSYENYMTKLQRFKRYYSNTKKDLAKSYLCDLEGDYPELYEQLYGKTDEEYVAVTGIQFPQDKITIGLQDIYKCFDNPIISPFNATEQGVIYTSSDTSILEVSGPIVMLTPHKTGTVTITASTEDGGYSDTIEVHVVEGTVADFGEWNVPAVSRTGKCGDDMGYALYENGLLIISGSGRMWDYGVEYGVTTAPWNGIGGGEANVIIRGNISNIGANAFYRCNGLLGSLTLPKSIVDIGDSAFYCCSGFTGDLVIPEGVTKIGTFAFDGCKGFTGDLVIPGSVTSIGKAAFRGCSGFSGNLVLTEGVDDIGSSAFAGCNGFSGDLVIPGSIEKIGSSAFSNCRGFTGDLVISEGVTALEPSAFAYCEGFAGKLVIPKSMVLIGASAFFGCSGFTGDLVIPGESVEIGEQAFYECKGFTGELLFLEDVVSIGDSAFRGCEGFTGDLVIPEGVTSIGDSAFSGCKGFTGDLVIPEGVTSIGDSAFAYCKGFTGDLVIPKSVICIDDYAFFLCEGLRGKLIISEGVVNIGDYAFYDCLGLTGDLVVPQSVTEIGGHAFQNCRGLTGKLVITKGVVGIGEYAFYGCSGLTGDLVIPEGVTKIGERAFCDCSGLTGRLVIPGSVTSLEDYVFKGCFGLTGELIIPESVTEIGDYAFGSCSGFTGNLVIPKGVVRISDSAFGNCGGFTGNLVIPESVTHIGEDAFAYCRGFTGNLEIPRSVIDIGDSAFYGCSGFTGNLEIPRSVTNIGDSAFYGCSGFTGNLMIPEGVDSIGNSVFAECDGFIGELIIPKGVVSIGDSAFRGCRGLMGSLVIPEGVTSIGYSAFYGCSGFTGNLEMPEGMVCIGGGAFIGCSGLTGDLVIPRGVTSIGGAAFKGCRGFTGNLVIPESVTEIGSSAFYGCRGLTGDLIIPEGVTEIDMYTFSYCTGLNGKLVIPRSVTSIGSYAFSGCSGLTGNLVIPEGVTEIGENVFEGCKGLTGNLVIPEGVVNISAGTFMGCSGLTNVEIPVSLMNIGYAAFVDCYSIKDVYYSGSKEQWIDIQIGEQNVTLTGAKIHYNSSKHDVVVDISDAAVNAEVSMTKGEQEDLLTKLLTEEELNEVEAGKEVVVEISISDKKNTLTDVEKQAVEESEIVKKFTIAQYLDISMSIKIGTGEKRSVTETDSMVRLVIRVPEELQQENQVFALMRLHNGDLNLLKDLDNDASTITIETDRFSTYVLMHRELQNDSNSISGTVAGFGQDTVQTILQLMDNNRNIVTSAYVMGNKTAYVLEDVAEGTYTLQASKQNHITREYTLTVGEEAVTQDVELHLVGDINGDGKINAKDKKVLYNHIACLAALEDYDLAVADVNGDGNVNARDKKTIYNHIAGLSLLW